MAGSVMSTGGIAAIAVRIVRGKRSGSQDNSKNMTERRSDDGNHDDKQDGTGQRVVPPAEWVAARKELLRKEKEFSRLRDELSRQRRALPWEKVEKNYVFDGPRGKETLADLFGGRSQLIVYHFMFGPGWKEGCPSCSYLADSFDGAAVHLAHRDVTFLAISRATLPEIEAFKRRMGWRFKWVSSFGNDFNYDYQVRFQRTNWRKETARSTTTTT